MTADIVTIIRKNPECYAPQLMQQAADEIELLRIGVATALRERDEARRDFCYCDDGWPLSDEQARQRADELGWDCFKENSDDRP